MAPSGQAALAGRRPGRRGGRRARDAERRRGTRGAVRRNATEPMAWPAAAPRCMAAATATVGVTARTRTATLGVTTRTRNGRASRRAAPELEPPRADVPVPRAPRDAGGPAAPRDRDPPVRGRRIAAAGTQERCGQSRRATRPLAVTYARRSPPSFHRLFASPSFRISAQISLRACGHGHGSRRAATGPRSAQPPPPPRRPPPPPRGTRSGRPPRTPGTAVRPGRPEPVSPCGWPAAPPAESSCRSVHADGRGQSMRMVSPC